MHRFVPRWPEYTPGCVPPNPSGTPFRDALDLVGFAELDRLTLWRTWPEVWHLDASGMWRCYSRGSSLDGVRTFADRPGEMVDCRLVPTGVPCGNYWVVIEPRHPWADDGEVNEHDAACFVRLRSSLARRGIWLLDVVVFDQTPRWWSLHELTSGTTAWDFPSRPRSFRSQRRPAR